MRPRTRREMLRTAGGLAGLGGVAGLAGCLGLLGNGDGGEDADSPAADVPDRAGALLSVDFEALRETDDLVAAANAELSARSGGNPQAPDSVAAALDGLATSYGLDPRGLFRAIGFVGEGIAETPTGTPARRPYWGVVGYSDWAGDEMRRSFRDAAPSRVRESTYEGSVVLHIGPESLATLGDGRVVLGSRSAVEDAVDVADGRADGVGGDLRRAFDATRGTYVRFGADLDAAAVATRVLGERAADAIPFSAIRHVRGAVFGDDRERGLRVVTKLGSPGKAEQLSAQIDSFVSIVRAQGVDEPGLQPYEDVIRGIETTTDGKQMTATYRTDGEDFAAAGGHLLAAFLLGLRQS